MRFCPGFGRWLCLQMEEHKILCREVAAACECSMSAVDNYRCGTCYPRMNRLLRLAELIASRRYLEWMDVMMEILMTASEDHKKTRPPQHMSGGRI